MRKRIRRETLPEELTLAIGLVWGHLNAAQFEQAHQLAKGCLRIWPEEKRLLLMAAYAAVELLEPLSEAELTALKSEDCAEWAQLVLRRSQSHSDGKPISYQ